MKDDIADDFFEKILASRQNVADFEKQYARIFSEDPITARFTSVCSEETVTDQEIAALCRKVEMVANKGSSTVQIKTPVFNVDATKLKHLGLLAIDADGKAHFTCGCNLLFDKNAGCSYIRCRVNGGTGESDRDIECSGSILEQIDDACKFVLSHIAGDGNKLPEPCIRELIINAVLNFDYGLERQITVTVYGDRLEFVTPGGLMRGMTVELMKKGGTNSRNKRLSQVFNFMNLSEDWGCGTPRLMFHAKACGLKEPEFSDLNGYFTVRVFRGAGASL